MKFLDETGLTTLWAAIKAKFVLKEAGKGLSANDFTATYKTKLDGIATGANNYVHPASHSPSIITQDLNNRFVTDSQIAIWDSKAGTSVVTTTVNGLMAFADKVKLDGIATGANNYVHPSTTGNKHIPSGGAAGKILVWSADGTAAWADPAQQSVPLATTTTSGLMSGEDKTKLDGINLANYVLSADLVALTNAEIDAVCV